MTLRVIAHFWFRADPAEQALPHLQGLVAPSREEDGCITYEPLLDVNDPSHVVFVEEWRDRDAFKQHLTGNGLTQVLAIVEPLLREPIVAYELHDLAPRVDRSPTQA